MDILAMGGSYSECGAGREGWHTDLVEIGPMQPIGELPRPEGGEKAALEAEEARALGLLLLLRGLALREEAGGGTGDGEPAEVGVVDSARVGDGGGTSSAESEVRDEWLRKRV